LRSKLIAILTPCATNSLLAYFAESAYRNFQDICQIVIAIQTNGTLLTPGKCALLKSLDFRVGVSVDGTSEFHDAARIYHSGHGTDEDVVAGWRNAQDAGLDPGLLCVINLDSDPVLTFQQIANFSPRIVDFLLPDANYELPPPAAGFRAAPYASWLLQLFDEWISSETPAYRVKIFENILSSLTGQSASCDALGTESNQILSIETNGAVGPTDVLKFCGTEYYTTGYNIAAHSIELALTHPNIQRYYSSNINLCSKCLDCSLSPTCGGGYLPHRYRASNNFDNPSVYCSDIAALITGIARRVMDFEKRPL
jgi:uncharacterized protein